MFENDVVLVIALVNRGNLPLSERVVKRVVDGRRRNAQPPGGVAVDDHVCL